MFAWKKRVSHMERHVDAALERLILQHRFLGVLMLLIGMPLLTLGAVCICTAIIILPISLALGWA